MTKKALQLCTASATADIETADKLTKFGKELQSCVAGLTDFLEEPLKSKALEIGKELQATLAGLTEPAKEKALDISPVMAAFASAQAVLSGSLKATQDKLQATIAGMPQEIVSAIEAKVKAGEYVSKADHDKAISDAISAATSAAKTAAVAEVKALADRRLALTTASIPVPADELLAGDDKAFADKQATAKKRVEELKPYKLKAERVLALAWNTDEAAYQASLSLMKEAFEAAGKGSAPNGFINRDSGDHKAAAPKSFGLC